jgi:hypothetical protein
MKNNYFFLIKQTAAIILLLVLSISLPVLAQENEKEILSAEIEIITEAGQTTKVFTQPFTFEKKILTGGETFQNQKLHLFNQTFATEKKQLGDDQPNLKSAKRAVSSIGTINGNKILSVSGTGTIYINATLASEGPIGTPDHYAVPTDQVLSIAAPGFLANDIDLDGEQLTAISIVDNADHGLLFAFADGSFNYTPDAAFIGTDQFSYRMQDASYNLSEPVTVTINVLPAANRNPIGIPDFYAMTDGTTLSVGAPGFLGNDIDLDGETLAAISIVDNANHGSLAAFADGSFNYTPDAGFTGTDQFSYRMQDASNNLSEPVTVTIEVYTGNRTPIGVNDQYAAVINSPLSIAAPGFLANDIDLDGEPLSAISIVDNVDHGTLAAFADGSFNYTPDAGFTGTDQFSYRMRDASNNTSEPVIVTIAVLSAGNIPVGVPDHYAVPTDQVLSIAAPGFLANDIDLDGEPLTAIAIVDNANHGSLVAFADGSFTYTPDAAFIGTDQFSYRMQDASNNLSEPVTVTINVLPAANRNPIGMPDFYAMIEGTNLSVGAPGFLGNDIDLDGETLAAISIVDNADHGSLAAFADGSFNYTPNAAFIGTDQFSYRMQDASNNLSEPVTVTIEVYAGNRAPIGIEDQYAALKNTPLSIDAPGFLANDLDLDGEQLSAISIVDNADHGTLAAFADGSFIYTPDAEFTGTDQFSYRMQDASGNTSEPVAVTIQVYETNKKPVADAGEDQTVECDGSELYTFNLDGSLSSDPEGDALIYTWRLNGDIIAGPSAEPTAEVHLEFGIHEIELTVEDVLGETDTDIVVVSVEDTTPPAFTVPGDITIFTTENCTWEASTSVTGDVTDESDNCDTDLDAVYNDVITPGECAGEIIITRTWTLTDDFENTASLVQVITVEDNIPPVIDTPDNYTICMEPMPDYLFATWTDNCSAGGGLTAAGELYSQTECTTTYSYLFHVMDDCGNEASEVVYVTRETEVFLNCETAYGYWEDNNVCFMDDKFKNWGWTNYFEPSETSYTMKLYAAAGQCDTNKGFQAGTVDVSYNNNEVTVTYDLIEGYVMQEAHVYAGCNKYPLFRGKKTVSPGNYTYNAGHLQKTNKLSVTFTGVSGGIYIIAHATVCEITCECSTTEYNSVSDLMYLGIDCNSKQSDKNPVADHPGRGENMKSGNIADIQSADLNVYPNPFSNVLNFEFTTYENVNATLTIYNALGQKVTTLLERNVGKGEVHKVSFIPEKRVSGVYIYHLRLNNEIRVGKVIYKPGS